MRIFGFLFLFSVSVFAGDVLDAAKNGGSEASDRASSKASPIVLSPECTDEDIFALQIFSEPLVPLSGKDDKVERAALVAALNRCLAGTQSPISADLTKSDPIKDFIAAFPKSRWRPALELNLATSSYRTGFFSDALRYWGSAYELAKNERESKAQAVADSALAQLIRMNARLGRMDTMETLLNVAKERKPRGVAQQIVSSSWDALYKMKNDPGDCFKCGPFALENVMKKAHQSSALSRKSDEPYRTPEEIAKAKSPHEGFSLQQVSEMATKSDFAHRLVKLSREQMLADIPVPSVVHWSLDHYGAILERSGDRYLVKDPTFDYTEWVPASAIAEEASGAFLVSGSPENARFGKSLSEAEASKLYGKGYPYEHEPNQTAGGDDQKGGDKEKCPMATYSVHTMMVSLHVQDTPVGYQPPYGPDVYVQVYNNERETIQPSVAVNYTHFGRQWNCNWTSFVDVTRWHYSASWTTQNNYWNFVAAIRGGGTESYMWGAGYYDPASVRHDPKSGAIVAEPSGDQIVRTLPDGSREIFGRLTVLHTDYVYVEGDSIAYQRRERYWLTAVVDPQGNYVSISYDAYGRIQKLTDPNGLETVFSYETTGNIYRVSKITDPYSREANFDYNSNEQLEKITDIIGIESEFTYDSGDNITEVTTPYGTSTIARSGGSVHTFRRIDLTDPRGFVERVQGSSYSQPGLPSTIPAGERPASSVTIDGTAVAFDSWSEFSDGRNSLFWSKKAMHVLQGVTDETERNQKGELIHWVHSEGGRIGSAIEFTKLPFSSRVYYNYPGQTGVAGSVKSHIPSKTARVIEGGATQLSQMSSNAFNNITRVVDPIGRELNIEYDSAGLNIQRIKRKTGASTSDTLAEVTWNGQRRPTEVVDASGNSTFYTYNGLGLVTSSTNAKNEVTTYTYGTGGYLIGIDGPMSGTTDKVTLTYDSFGRVETAEFDNRSLTYEYDAADRVTKVIFPDSSYEEYEYTNLSLTRVRDRLGRWTEIEYNANREVVKVTDPLMRETSYEWCLCGKLQKLIDGNGNLTKWKYDLQGRLLEKEYANGKKDVYDYTSERSLLERITDAKDQKKNFSYAIDDSLVGIDYEDEVIPTPSVALTWDARYRRVVQMIDGSGTTSYGYVPVGQNGAGLYSSVDGPLPADVIGHVYDELGRPVSRQINGSNNEEEWSYDSSGRVIQNTSTIGIFNMVYDGPSSRVQSVSRVGGMTTSYAYSGSTADYRLAGISHVATGTVPTMTFGYESNVMGNITKWTRQLPGESEEFYELGYDAADQLVTAVLKQNGVPTPLASHSYSFDGAGNRIEADGVSAYFNNLNQIKGIGEPANTVVSGTVNRPSLITVNGGAVNTVASSTFSTELELPVGEAEISIEAVSGSKTKTSVWRYEVQPERKMVYDLNGNLVDDEERSFEWDAQDRLVAINYHGNQKRTEFSYDGFSRRVAVVEKDGLLTVTTSKYLWDGLSIAESRLVDGETVDKAYYAQGYQAASNAYYYMKDHLGSVRGLIDSSGVVRGAWDYSVWGKRGENRVSVNAVESDVSYTGHFYHAPSKLELAPFRAYCSDSAVWLSRDPLENAEVLEGPNLYAYCFNNPISLFDPYGLSVLDYIPVVRTLKNGFVPPPGANVADYNIYLNPEDGSLASDKAEQRIRCQEAAFMAAYFGQSLGAGIIELGASMVLPPLLIDVAGNTVINFIRASQISDAANKAIEMLPGR